MSSFYYYLTHIDLPRTCFLLALLSVSLIFIYILKKSANLTAQTKPTAVHKLSSQDIKAVAGDDVMTTQLDLARAYIEIGKKKLAQQILQHVKDHGNAHHQHEAHELSKAL